MTAPMHLPEGAAAAALLPPDIRAELARVEALCAGAIGDPSPLVARLAGHGLASGGKRLRAALCLLAGRCGNPARRGRVQRTAAGLELVHLASLIHDDVVDASPTRRGRPAAWALWGQRAAVLGGDYLFAASFDLLGAGGDPAMLRLAARTVRELAAGALAEQESAGDFSGTRRAYYQRIRRKTAGLVSSACRAGALAAGCSPRAQAALAAYGRLLGLAFQITDDILDLTGDPARTGKPTGGDLRAGILTLPMLYGQGDAAARAALLRCWHRPGASPAAIGRAVAALEACGAIARARAEARRLARRARAALRPLAAPGPVAALERIAAWCVARDA